MRDTVLATTGGPDRDREQIVKHYTCYQAERRWASWSSGGKRSGTHVIHRVCRVYPVITFELSNFRTPHAHHGQSGQTAGIARPQVI